MKFIISAPKDLEGAFSYATSMGKCVIEIHPPPKQRTKAQNRLLHVNIHILSEHVWYDMEDTKIEVKDWIHRAHEKTGKYLPMIWETPKWKKKYLSSAWLDTKPFTLLMNWVYDLWRILWCKMAYPDDLWIKDKLFDCTINARAVFKS